MFKKCISYCVIISLLAVDAAPAMRRSKSTDDLPKETTKHLSRRLSDEYKPADLQAEGPSERTPLLLRKNTEPQEGENFSQHNSQRDSQRDSEFFIPPNTWSDEYVGLQIQGGYPYSHLPYHVPYEYDPFSASLSNVTSAEYFVPQGRVQKYLFSLGISHPFKPEEMAALEELFNVEQTWRNYVVWGNHNYVGRALFALMTSKRAVKGGKNDHLCSPLWLQGGALPLQKDFHIKKTILLNGAGKGLEEGIIDSVHVTLVSLLTTQFYQDVSGSHWKMSFSFIKTFFENSDTVSSLGVIHALHSHPALFAVVGVPVALAFMRAAWDFLRMPEPTDEAVKKIITHLKKASPTGDGALLNGLSLIPPFSSLLFFHPARRAILRLAQLILWNGKLPDDVREEAFEAIRDCAKNGKGITQMAAIEALQQIAHGLNTRSLHLLKSRPAEALLKIKIPAFTTLKEIYKDLPKTSINKPQTGVLLWEMGQSPSWSISLMEPPIKLIRGVLYAGMIYEIGKVLWEYFNCPYMYLKNFTWNGGVTNYASDYGQDCFDAQVKFFNEVSGQPAETLIGNLTQYNFPNGTYALDLSNKGIDGAVIAEIVEGFNNASIPLVSLKIPGNVVQNPEHIERILNALPSEIIELDMSNIGYGLSINFSDTSTIFSKLGRLMGLQSLSLGGIENSNYSPNDIGAIGEALQALPNLQKLTLRMPQDWEDGANNTNIGEVVKAFKPSWTHLDITNFNLLAHEQILLGEALAKTPTFQSLCLGGINIGYNNDTANIALANGLAAQADLCTLDLSNNLLGGEWWLSNVNTSALFESLPSSITTLNIGGNYIGSHKTSDVSALANAIGRMSKLTTFNAQDYDMYSNEGYFSYSTCLLDSLYKKQNLTFLDLSYNTFNDTVKMQSLLETLPNLKVLNIEENQLTGGAILSPALSTLTNLTILNLWGNDFDTEDRIAIANATSSLPLSASPLFLDTNQNFTDYFLGQISSNATALNLSGLIPSEPDALEDILSVIVQQFTNLTQLDLSNNCIFDFTGYIPLVGGIEALETYLPQLPNLRFLDISNPVMNTQKFFANMGLPLELRNFTQFVDHMPNLQTLDLSNIPFLYDDALGEALANIHSLTYLNISGISGSWQSGIFGMANVTWQGGDKLIRGIQAQTNLTQLDLSNNLIGGLSYISEFTGWPETPNPNATRSLISVLNNLTQLQSLSVSNNFIGYEDQDGAIDFVNALADVVQKRNLQFNIMGGIFGITWNQTDAFQNLTGAITQKILKACAKEICTGKPFNETNQGAPEEPQTSAASRTMPPLHGLGQSLKSWVSFDFWTSAVGSWVDGVIGSAVAYAKDVVNASPSYFPGKLDTSAPSSEGRNMAFFNYPSPHIRKLGQRTPLSQVNLNYTQAGRTLPHVDSYPLMLSK